MKNIKNENLAAENFNCRESRNNDQNISKETTLPMANQSEEYPKTKKTQHGKTIKTSLRILLHKMSEQRSVSGVCSISPAIYYVRRT